MFSVYYVCMLGKIMSPPPHISTSLPLETVNMLGNM